MSWLRVLAIVCVVGVAAYWAGRSQVPAAPVLPPPAPAKVNAVTQSPPVEESCTGSCKGHRAGYSWAQNHFLDDERECDFAGVHSDFRAGCREYVDSQKTKPEPTYYHPPSDMDDPPQDNDDQ